MENVAEGPASGGGASAITGLAKLDSAERLHFLYEIK
jgi:hypothetical protein